MLILLFMCYSSQNQSITNKSKKKISTSNFFLHILPLKDLGYYTAATAKGKNGSPPKVNQLSSSIIFLPPYGTKPLASIRK
jgi:hypothetical protein